MADAKSRGRPNKPKGSTKDVQLSMRFNSALKEMLSVAAEEHRISLCEEISRRLYHSFSPAEARPSLEHTSKVAAVLRHSAFALLAASEAYDAGDQSLTENRILAIVKNKTAEMVSREAPNSAASKTPREPLLLSVAEAATMLGVDPKFVRRGVEANTIPAVKVGRLIKIARWWVLQQRDGIAPKGDGAAQ